MRGGLWPMSLQCNPVQQIGVAIHLPVIRASTIPKVVVTPNGVPVPW